jgi:ubiquinone/menaquinone biosynthesis C-methylase UbiE
MREPFRTKFAELVTHGAAVQDIYDSAQEVGYAVTHPADSRFVDRELKRVEQHRQNACWLLEEYVGSVQRILDAGCGTGGFSVAMAASLVLRPSLVVGIDVSSLALEAATVRATGYDVPANKLSFLHWTSGDRLPFDDNSFDLTVCSSVIEFMTSRPARNKFLTELKRVTRSGGHVFISTPSPLRLHEYHSGALLGDYFHRPGHPWANPHWEISRMFSNWREIPVTKYYRRKLMLRLGANLPIPDAVINAIAWIAPWQNRLFQKQPI